MSKFVESTVRTWHRVEFLQPAPWMPRYLVIQHLEQVCRGRFSVSGRVFLYNSNDLHVLFGGFDIYFEDPADATFFSLKNG